SRTVLRSTGRPESTQPPSACHTAPKEERRTCKRPCLPSSTTFPCRLLHRLRERPFSSASVPGLATETRTPTVSPPALLPRRKMASSPSQRHSEEAAAILRQR